MVDETTRQIFVSCYDHTSWRAEREAAMRHHEGYEVGLQGNKG